VFIDDDGECGISEAEAIVDIQVDEEGGEAERGEI